MKGDIRSTQIFFFSNISKTKACLYADGKELIERKKLMMQQKKEYYVPEGMKGTRLQH